MSIERHHNDASSSDSVAAQILSEKPPVEPVSPQEQEQEQEQEQHQHERDVTPTSEGNDNENVIEKKESGLPLDRTPSQAAKMGKKKIAVVMTALCVRIYPGSSEMRRKSLQNVIANISSTL